MSLTVGNMRIARTRAGSPASFDPVFPSGRGGAVLLGARSALPGLGPPVGSPVRTLVPRGGCANTSETATDKDNSIAATTRTENMT